MAFLCFAHRFRTCYLRPAKLPAAATSSSCIFILLCSAFLLACLILRLAWACCYRKLRTFRRPYSQGICPLFSLRSSAFPIQRRRCSMPSCRCRRGASLQVVNEDSKGRNAVAQRSVSPLLFALFSRFQLSTPNFLVHEALHSLVIKMPFSLCLLLLQLLILIISVSLQ